MSFTTGLNNKGVMNRVVKITVNNNGNNLFTLRIQNLYIENWCKWSITAGVNGQCKIAGMVNGIVFSTYCWLAY